MYGALEEGQSILRICKVMAQKQRMWCDYAPNKATLGLRPETVCMLREDYAVIPRFHDAVWPGVFRHDETLLVCHRTVWPGFRLCWNIPME